MGEFASVFADLRKQNHDKLARVIDQRTVVSADGGTVTLDDNDTVPVVSPLVRPGDKAMVMELRSGQRVAVGAVAGRDSAGVGVDIYRTMDLAATQWYDSRAFADIQTGIDTVHEAGGGVMFVGAPIPDGQDIVLRDGVYLVGRGVGATTLNVRTITGSGAVRQLPALAANIAQHSRTVTFAEAPDLAPGDVFILADSADSSFNAARTYYRAGEFCRVRSVSGTTVGLTRPTYAAYSAGSTVTPYKMVPIRTGVMDMTIRCTMGQTGIKVTYGTDLVFRDLALSGTNVSHLTLSRCYNVDIDNVKAFDASPAVGTNYGVSIVNCQRLRISDVDLETTRHGLTLTGEGIPTLCTVPNRDVQISDAYIAGMSGDLGVNGCNLHGNCEDISLDNVTMPAGFNPGGDYISVRNSDIGSAAWGTAISAMELLGVNLTFEHNIIRANANHDPNRGLVYLATVASTTRNVGHLRFIGNMVDLGPYMSGNPGYANAVYILSGSSSGATWRHLEIRGNTFFSSSGALTTSRGVRIRADAGTDQWREIDVVDNGGNMPVVATESQTLMFFSGWGSALPSFAAAPGSTYRRRVNAGTGAGAMYVNKNGDTTWTAM